jgi:hypothetical protein
MSNDASAQYDDVALTDRVRSTLHAVTSSTTYCEPPAIGTAETGRGAPRRLIVAAAALLLVLVVVATVALVRPTGDRTRIDRLVPPGDEQPIFPDVVPHQGAPLLLVPQSVPEGFHLLYATGPDPNRPGSSYGSGANSTYQSWVKLDPTGTRPVAGMTLAWGPADLADTQLPLGGGPTIGHQDALTAYGNAEPLTVNGHSGVWAEYLQTVAWEQDGKAISVSASMDNWTGAWPEHLTRADLEAIAASVIRLGDDTYQMTNPPAGFRRAATSPGWIKTGDNARRLVYTDDNGRGFAIQLVDNTQAPPGAALTVAVARLTDVRGQRAVQTPFLNGGDGSGCSTIDSFLCSNSGPGNLDGNYLQWLEPDSTRVTLTGVGISTDQLLDIARSLHEVGTEDWDTLTKTANAIPCAQLARCGAPAQ